MEWFACAPEVDAASVGDACAEEVEMAQSREGRDRAQADVREAAAVQVQLRHRRQPRHRRQSQIPNPCCTPIEASSDQGVVCILLLYGLYPGWSD